MKRCETFDYNEKNLLMWHINWKAVNRRILRINIRKHLSFAAYLQVLDLPWPNAPPIQRDCLCSNRSLPINIKSTSNIAEVHFTIQSMDALDDYNNLFFEGVWEFVKTVHSECMPKHKVRGPSGEIKYTSPIEEDEVNIWGLCIQAR